MKNMLLTTAAVLMTAFTLHAQKPIPPPPPSPPVPLPLERDIVKAAPYSAEIATEHVQALADGNRIVRRTTARVYRDNQGRVRREEDRPGGGVGISISDPVAGVSYTLDSARKTARQMRIGPLLDLAKMTVTLENVKRVEANVEAAKKAAELGDSYKAAVAKDAAAAGVGAQGGGRGGPVPVIEARRVELVPDGVGVGAGFVAFNAFTVKTPGGEEVEERLSDRVIEGVVASGRRVTRTIPSGAIGNEQPIKIVSEEWRSPELQVLVMTDRTDPQTGRTTYRLSHISRADPDPLLFLVPGDYTLVQAPGLGAGAGGRGREPKP